MKLYCGMDLHSTNTMVVVIDEEDHRLIEQRLPNDLVSILEQLEPYREQLVGIAVESTYNWYWLVDGLMDHGYSVQLVNTTAAQQNYSGLKYAGDRHDAFWLAHLMRLKILPTGYIYPRPLRWQRDLLRQRLNLVRERARHRLALQSLWALHRGRRLSFRQLHRGLAQLRMGEPALDLALDAHRRTIGLLDDLVEELESAVYRQLKPTTADQLLHTVNGIGPVLAATINLETGSIERFARVGQYSSYCRLVKSERRSNAKKKGEGNRKCGNKYLSWAYSEAAHFAVRYDDRARRFYDRKKAQRNGIVAIRAVAHKLARACYFILRDQVEYRSDKVFV